MVSHNLVMPTLNVKIKELFGFDFCEVLAEMAGAKKSGAKKKRATKGRGQRARGKRSGKTKK